MPRAYSLKDVAEHSSKDCPWFIIKDKVYDVTKLLDEHPGGERVLMEYAGKDATQGFYGRHHSASAQKWLKDFEIGSLGCAKQWWQCPLCYGAAAVAVGVAAFVAFKLLRH